MYALKSHRYSQLGVLGAHPSGGSLKSWCDESGMYSSNPELFREKVGVGDPLLFVWYCARVVVGSENVSPLLPHI